MAKMIINGKQLDAVSGETLDVVSPVTGKPFTTIPRGKKADVDLAVQAARDALGGEWGSYDALQRSRLLLKLSAKILENLDELADLESRDTGKTVSTARDRKSTRLNSSHVAISYAVFCLKKKKLIEELVTKHSI